MELDKLTYIIRGALFEVYNELGPGLLESIYSEALAIELSEKHLDFKREVPVPVYYKCKKLRNDLRADFIIENQVILELKSVEAIKKVHHKQLLTYLKLSEIQIGILVNFNEGDFSRGITRKLNTKFG